MVAFIVKVVCLILTVLLTFPLQLRNLVWATSKHDVYLMSNYSVLHWSALSCQKSEIMNVSGHVAPSEVHALLLTFGKIRTHYLIFVIHISALFCCYINP